MAVCSGNVRLPKPELPSSRECRGCQKFGEGVMLGNQALEGKLPVSYGCFGKTGPFLQKIN